MFASLLNSSVMLGDYLQQTTSVDDILRCIFWRFEGLEDVKQSNKQWRRDARSDPLTYIPLREKKNSLILLQMKKIVTCYSIWRHLNIFIVVSENEKHVSQFITDFQQISTAQR